MKQFPGCYFFEPDDLGFNAQAIAALGLVVSPIFPITALMLVKSATFYFLDTGPSTDLDLYVQPVDIDGVTELGASLTEIVTGMDPLVSKHVLIHIESALVRSSNGVVSTGGSAFLGLPYARLRVNNKDAVNAATVTLRLSLCGALK